MLPTKAEKGAPQRAAPSKSSLTKPHFARIGRRYRQELLATITELFDRENHCFGLDGRDAHSSDGLANSHLVLVSRRDVSQNRNRVLAPGVVGNTHQFQVCREGLGSGGSQQ